MIHHSTIGYPDDNGTELPDEDAAWAAATTSVGDMIRELDGKLRPNTEWSMEVADHVHRPLFSIRVITRTHK